MAVVNRHVWLSYVVVTLLGICVMAGDGHGWEFSMTGGATYTYLYYSQAGTRGFFGPSDVDRSAAIATLSVPPLNPVGGQKPTLTTVNNTNVPGDFATANGWLGLQTGGVVSGSDAARSFFSTVLNTRLQVNPAFRLEGSYRIGNSDTFTFPGNTVAFAVGEWLAWWATAELPWGRVVFGKRPFGFGCGFQYDVTNRTEEYLTLVTQHGPVSLGLGFYPWRRSSQLLNPVFSAPVYWNDHDQNAAPRKDWFGFVHYESANVEAGIGGTYAACHFGPESSTRIEDRERIPALDTDETEGWIYFKYFNGRFFFDAEADWFYKTSRFRRSLSGTFLTADGEILPETTDGSGSIFRPRYTEAWRYMLQSGLVLGPGKLSALYAYLPGPDRRHGALIDRQPVAVDVLRPSRDLVLQYPDHSNSVAFQPYSMLLSTAFGGGLGATGYLTPTRPVNGYMTDAQVFAGRVDYAVAANLNTFASFLYARRNSKGYGWGYCYLDRASLGSNQFQAFFQPTRNFSVPVPAIPDDDLGWEVNLGVDWAILDGVLLRLGAAYWQPGQWFRYAHIDRSIGNWNFFSAASNWGVNPNRKIDPVTAVNASWTVLF
ncbi:MAG: hypothetical protein AB1646_01315 [Thermodesulfobacteriota bacterium]